MKQQYPGWEYVISLPGLSWGLSLSMRKKVAMRHKDSAASKRRNSLGRFSGGINTGAQKYKNFCQTILPGFRAGKSAIAVKLCLPDGAVRL